MSLNACDVILAAGARQPDAPAIHAVDAQGQVRILSFGELIRWVAQAVDVLAQAGVRRGDRVLLMLPDSPYFCAAFLGAIKHGAIAIPINPRLAPSDYAYLINDSDPSLLIVGPEYRSLINETAGHPVLTLVAFASALAAASAGTRSARTEPGEQACWLYSSGTTGRPKGIMHTHATVARSGELHRNVLRSKAGTRVFSTSKLFFAFPLENAFLGPVAIGAVTLINESWPEPEQVIEWAERFAPDVFFTVPTMIRRLLAHPSERLAPFRRVTHCYTGGERLPEAIVSSWEDAVHTELRECYGTSETFCNVFAQRAGHVPRGSCGEALPEVETKLLDHQGGPVPKGDPGVLWVRLPTLTVGYTDPAAASHVFRDGWFCTNDMFTVDTDGCWFHQGRADELMKVAGQWVKPAEVEAAVIDSKHIREAACVMVPDQDGFDRLALFIVAGDASTLSATEFARQQASVKLPKHSQPKWIREVTELPRTSTGKIQRFRLRETLHAPLELGKR